MNGQQSAAGASGKADFRQMPTNALDGVAQWLGGSVVRWPSGLLAKQPTSGTTFAATAIESEAERLELGLRLGLGPGMDI